MLAPPATRTSLLLKEEGPEEEEQELNDVDWNEIMAEEPSDKAKHHMQVFLQGYLRWQQAQERFEVAFDGLHTELTNLLETGVIETFVELMQGMDLKSKRRFVRLVISWDIIFGVDSSWKKRFRMRRNSSRECLPIS